MPRVCVTCNHPERAQIELCVATRVPYKEIEERFGVSASSVFRHAQGHMGERPSKALEIREQADDLRESGFTKDPDILLALLADLYATAQTIGADALMAAEPRLALAAAKEATNIIQVIAKFTEKTQGPAPDLEAEQDLHSLTVALRRALPKHPEAARDIVKELRDQACVSLAEVIERVISISGEVVNR